jgi:hypothetical protein
MKYQVVNPSTGQVEQEYPTASDAEIGQVIVRVAAGGGVLPAGRGRDRARAASACRR